jgi:two-component system OmpR family sensor kinase
MDESAPLAKQQTNLVELASISARDSAAIGSKSKIVIVDLHGKKLAKNAEVMAAVDASSMRQVLTNLLVNAAKFSKPKGQIEIALAENSGRVVLEVRDHGEGIPAALREKVFERFFRADNSRNRETGGSGLGLSIVKNIVTRHGGDIKALETPGGGATFRVTLPTK